MVLPMQQQDVVWDGNATHRNPPFHAYPTAPPPSENFIQRGYLRLLTEVFEFYDRATAISMTPKWALTHELGAQLHFQFNPNQLTRDVTARTDTQLWINQSPEQLLQPGIGDMSFRWTMLFNREAEVRAARNGPNGTDQTKQRLADALEATNPSLDTVPDGDMAARFGVIADIMVMDRITGQRITEEAIDYARERYEKLVLAGLIDEDDIEGPEEGMFEGISESLKEDILGANSHNSAFLVPNPIRAVFSENFMVDGYVNSVTVSYQKFSPTMIPTVAVVDVDMHAIYQGFARKSTTFTTFLELGQTDREESTFQARDRPEGDEIGSLHDLGKEAGSHSVLAGINHDGSTRLDKVDIEGIDTGDVGSVNAKFDGGFKFRLFGKVSGNPLGEALLHKKESDNWDDFKDKLKVEAKVGMSLRARLTQTDKTKLDVLIQDISAYTNTDDFFFGDWEPGERAALFAIGVDSPTPHADATPYNTQGGPPYYTQSFPITERGNGVFGDTPSLSELFVYPSSLLEFIEVGNETWLRVDSHFGNRDGDVWAGEFRLAKGFYEGFVEDSGFPPTITLEGSTNIVYHVEYQLRLVLRAALIHDTSLLMDTGLMYIYPSAAETDNMHQRNLRSGSTSGPKVEGSLSSEYSAGGIGLFGAADKPWIKADTELSFNAVSTGQGHIFKFTPEDSSARTIENGNINTVFHDGWAR